MRSFLDTRDLIPLLERRDPCDAKTLAGLLDRGGHQLVLTQTVVFELSAPIVQPATPTVVTRLLNELESIPLVYLNDGQLMPGELREAVRRSREKTSTRGAARSTTGSRATEQSRTDRSSQITSARRSVVTFRPTVSRCQAPRYRTSRTGSTDRPPGAQGSGSATRCITRSEGTLRTPPRSPTSRTSRTCCVSPTSTSPPSTGAWPRTFTRPHASGRPPNARRSLEVPPRSSRGSNGLRLGRRPMGDVRIAPPSRPRRQIDGLPMFPVCGVTDVPGLYP